MTRAVAAYIYNTRPYLVVQVSELAEAAKDKEGRPGWLRCRCICALQDDVHAVQLRQGKGKGTYE